MSATAISSTDVVGESSRRPLISVVTPCFNEEDNVDALYERIKAVFAGLPALDYEQIFIDNRSTDGTVKRIEALAIRDPNVKLIVNTRNFGHIRSPYYAMLQASGDAVISMASDLQDPPELIPRFVELWQRGFKVVIGVKPESEETAAMRFVRKSYYRVLAKVSEVKIVPNYTGFGLYDRTVMSLIRQIDDPYPYFRGLISELGFAVAEVTFKQPKRVRGITKNNFFTLYDIGMLGLTTHSKAPLRLATMAGFALGTLSLLISFVYLVLKLVYWDRFVLGQAPVLIGLFFFSSIQLFFVGLLGEYILAIHTQILKRPLVVEDYRRNFDRLAPGGASDQAPGPPSA